MTLQMPVLAVGIEGFGEAPLQQISTRVPLRDGGIFLAVQTQPREVVFTLHMRATTRAEMWELRRRLSNLMNPLFGAFTVRIYGDDHTQYELRQCHFQDGFAGGIGLSWPLLKQEITVTVLSYDPMLYQLPMLAYASTVPVLLEGLIFPATFPIFFYVTPGINEIVPVVTTGNWYTYPTIVFTGPLQDPYVQNLTVPGKIGLYYTIPVGVTVTVTTEPENCTVVDSLGNNLFGELTEDSDISTFKIAPEVLCDVGHNDIQLVGGAGTVGVSSIVLYWSNRWVTL
jgi:hypothetical protein